MKSNTTTKLKKLISAGLIGATLSSFAAGTTTYGSTSKFSCTGENFGKYTHNSDIYKDYIEDFLKKLKSGHFEECVELKISMEQSLTGCIMSVITDKGREIEVILEYNNGDSNFFANNLGGRIVFNKNGRAIVVVSVVPHAKRWRDNNKTSYYVEKGDGVVYQSNGKGFNLPFAITNDEEIDLSKRRWKLDKEDKVNIVIGKKSTEIEEREENYNTFITDFVSYINKYMIDFYRELREIEENCTDEAKLNFYEKWSQNEDLNKLEEELRDLGEKIKATNEPDSAEGGSMLKLVDLFEAIANENSDFLNRFRSERELENIIGEHTISGEKITSAILANDLAKDDLNLRNFANELITYIDKINEVSKSIKEKGSVSNLSYSEIRNLFSSLSDLDLIEQSLLKYKNDSYPTILYCYESEEEMFKGNRIEDLIRVFDHYFVYKEKLCKEWLEAYPMLESMFQRRIGWQQDVNSEQSDFEAQDDFIDDIRENQNQIFGFKEINDERINNIKVDGTKLWSNLDQEDFNSNQFDFEAQNEFNPINIFIYDPIIENKEDSALVTKEDILKSINSLKEDEFILIEQGRISSNLSASNPLSDILLNDMFARNLLDFIYKNKIASVIFTKGIVKVMFNNGKTTVLKDENFAKLLAGNTNDESFFETNAIKDKKIYLMNVEENETTDRNDFDQQNNLTKTNNYDTIIENKVSDDESEGSKQLKELFRNEEELRNKIEKLSGKKIGKLIYDTTNGSEKSNEELLKACRGKKVVIVAKVKNGGIIGGYVDLNGEENSHGENVFYLTNQEEGPFKDKEKIYFVEENGYLKSKKIFGDYFSWYDADFISFDVEKCNLYKLDNQKLVIGTDPNGEDGANYWIEDIKVYKAPLPSENDTSCILV